MIVRMAKLQVLGPRRLLPDVLDFLQEQGVLQLRQPPGQRTKTPHGPLLRPVHVDPKQGEVEHALEEAIRRVDAFVLPPQLSGEGTPSTAGSGERPVLPDVASPDFVARLGELDGQLKALQRKRGTLIEEQGVVTRYGHLLVAIAPLKPALPEGVSAHTLGIVVRRAHPEALKLLEDAVFKITDGIYDLQTRPVDEEMLGVVLAVPEAHAHEVSALLFERGVEEVRLPDMYSGQPLAEALTLLLRREREIPGELLAVDRETSDFVARWRPLFAQARAEAQDRLARLRAIANCGETGLAFVVAGWLPSNQLSALRQAISARYAEAVTLNEYPVTADEYEQVPVVLRNSRWTKPFEVLLSLVPLPRYGSIDPTPFLAVFFPIFLGFVLGDVALGVVALGAGLLVIKTGWGGRLLHDASFVAIVCAGWSIVFGILFGEALGDLGERFGLRPILVDRGHAFVLLLVAAVAMGAVHVIVGMVLGIVDAARNGHVREALARVAKLGLLLVAALGIGGAAGYVPAEVARVSLVAVGVLLVSGTILGGFMLPLEIVLAFGNILSYARLMALGLASVLLADVANRLAVSVKPTALGVGIAILIHAANFVMAFISPVVAALRLHYVEFFEKFYEGGGEPYHPFAHVT